MRDNLLIVDDDKMIRVALNRMFKRKWRVHAASHSREALVTMHFGQIDVALIDWHPHGEQTVEHCIMHNVPFVVFTGDPSDVPEAIKEDYTVLAKPSSEEEIENALHNALGR